MFEREINLIGEDNYLKLKNSNILVIGVGGVGGYAVETLIRSGIENITLVDYDNIDISNINRQVIALSSNIGNSKVEEFKKRILSINSNVKVKIIKEKINEDNIEMLENFDTNNLNETQKYLLSCIEDGKVKNISEIKLQENVRKDALKHKIVEQREESKKKKKKRMFKAILIAVIVNIVMRVAFNIISEMNFENNMIPIISFVIYVIALMIFALYPTIVIISFIIYNVKSTLDPYFRTKEGEELNRSIEGLKNYLKDYTLLDEQEKDGIVVWEEYLVYSVLFNQNKKMIEKYKSIVK